MTKLGRNPFGKKDITPDPKLARSEGSSAPLCSAVDGLEWLLIDLPAETFLFALKTVLFVKGVFEKKRNHP